MRLRHKKGAEELILNEISCIQKPSLNFTYFNNDNPVYLELGMGKGKFVIENALINNDINFIGIEKYATVLLKAVDKYKEIKKSDTENKKLNNIKFLCEDVQSLDKFFNKNSISKIYLNFSDPWPKKRHENRRLTHANFLKIYEYLLITNGTLEFKTDNKLLFDFTIEQIKNSNFKMLEFTYDLHNDFKLNEDNIMTEYEEKFSKKGNPICKLVARI